MKIDQKRQFSHNDTVPHLICLGSVDDVTIEWLCEAGDDVIDNIDDDDGISCISDHQ